MSRPYFMASGRIDLRAFAGVEVFKRAVGTPITLPDFTASDGLYEDAIELACGRGSAATDGSVGARRDMTSEIQAALGIGDAWVTLTTDGRIEIGNLDGAFDLHAGAGNTVWGLPAEGASSILLLSGAHVIRGETTWQRGPVRNATITIEKADPVTIPAWPYHAQSLIALMRRRGREADVFLPAEVPGGAGAFDIDDATTDATPCLEALDNAIYDAAYNRIRHFIDEAGHYVIAWPSGISLAAPTWLSEEVRDILGYTGLQETGRDTLTTADGVTAYRAGRAVRGTLATLRPWRHLPRPIAGGKVEARRRVGGGTVTNAVDTWTDLLFGFWLEGPNSNVSTDDTEGQYFERFLPFVPQGRPVSIIIGRDDRRHQRDIEVTAERPAHSLLYTTDICGGRWRGTRSPDDSGEVRPEYIPGDYWAEGEFRLGPPRRGS